MLNLLEYIKCKRQTNYWMRNASPSKEDDGTMIAYWEKEKGIELNGISFQCPKCRNSFSREKLDGGHVVMAFSSKNCPQYITPLCHKCNRSHDNKPFWVPKKNVIPVPSL